MTTVSAPPHVPMAAARALLAVTARASRSPWVWTPAAVGTAGLATATVALARLLTAPPAALPAWRTPWLQRLAPVRPGVVRLSGPGATAPGYWGVEFPNGYGFVGKVLVTDGDAAERPFRLLSGALPGDEPARMNAHLWLDRESFSSDTGIAGRELVLHGETGPLASWVFPAGDGGRWCVLVHGRGAPRAQMLRLVPALHARGITALVISYRNDDPGCSDPSGRMHFGHREWRDLEVAVAAAGDAGAHDVVLAGMSMGGGIIATFLRRSELAGMAIASILDAPALNWGPILRHVARGRRIPGWIVPGVMTTVALQAQVDWKALNHTIGDHHPAPVLLVHGDVDPVVPVELSDAFAESRPDLVTYLRVAGAGHVAAWNADPTAYDAAVHRFLAQLAPSRQGHGAR
jgi:uncharacterized protein